LVFFRRTLSVPVIDGIQWDDFAINPVYARNSHSRGLFEWGMLYKEGNVPPKEEKRRSHHSEPYYAPTHAGGLFAINREWFKELGWYDPGECLLFFLYAHAVQWVELKEQKNPKYF
jgi:polypeptide N-acetylgalactosaminyltransferase